MTPRTRLRRFLRAAAAAALLAQPLPARAAPGGEDQRWMWPTGSPSPVLSSFAPPAHDWLPGRRGVDLDVPGGTPIVAAADGVVAFAGPVAAQPVISVEHERAGSPVWATYVPAQAEVEAGQRGVRGQVIGRVPPGADHLHWGARTGPRAYTDPIRLTLGPVVLKPWE